MQLRRIGIGFTLALLAAAPAAFGDGNELEAFVGYYYPSDIEIDALDAQLNYEDDFSYGVRYGRRINEVFGVGVSWSHFEADAARSDKEVIGCSTCDLDYDFADFSFEWYPGGGEFALFAGLGWVTGDFSIDIPGDSNDIEASDDAFTYHFGAAYTWLVGDVFYIRPDARIRFLELDSNTQDNYDSEDPEVRVGFGWRF